MLSAHLLIAVVARASLDVVIEEMGADAQLTIQHLDEEGRGEVETKLQRRSR